MYPIWGSISSAFSLLLLRKRKASAARAARPTTPPTTPPAIAPTLVFELPVVFPPPELPLEDPGGVEEVPVPVPVPPIEPEPVLVLLVPVKGMVLGEEDVEEETETTGGGLRVASGSLPAALARFTSNALSV